MSGESESANAEEVGVWKIGVLPLLLSKYHPKYIFKEHEWRLLFSLLPHKI
jgi:hypothetical protein